MQVQAQTTVTVHSVSITFSEREAKLLLPVLDVASGSDVACETAGSLRHALGLVHPVDFVRSGAVDDFIRHGQKIVAIKEVRAASGTGLKSAKDAVEDRAKELASGIAALREKLGS